jgi:uncharacterized protein DUF4157
MRHHEHDHDDPAVETAPQSRTEPLDPSVMKAVAAGRPEVVGHAGMLGLQRFAGNRAAAGVAEDGRSPVHDVVSGGGSPLDEDVRTDMEARMGQDFSDVRIHTGDAADASARSVSAHAYTVGPNIVFQRGGYEPGSEAGQKLLAHELTHVVQQRSGPVDGTPAPGGVSVSDPSDRFELEAAANAERVMGQPAAVAPVQAPVPQVQAEADPTLPAVQREGEEEQEEEVQAAHDPALGPVQRQEEEEEPEEA